MVEGAARVVNDGPMYTIAGIAVARLRGQIAAVGLDPGRIFEAVGLPADGHSVSEVPLAGHDLLESDARDVEGG